MKKLLFLILSCLLTLSSYALELKVLVGLNYNFNKPIDSLSISEVTKLQPIIGFHQGTITALEELTQMGYVIDVKFIQGTEDSSKQLQLLNQFGNGFQLAIFAGFGNPTVYFKPDLISLAGSKWVKCSFNYGIQVHTAALNKYIEDNYYKNKVYIIHKNNPLENNIASEYKKALKTNKNNDTIIDIASSTIDSNFLKKRFYKQEVNVIVLTSPDETYCNKVLNTLSSINYGFSMVVFGLPNWSNFKMIDVAVLNKLNVQLTQNLWIASNDEQTLKFRKLYQQKWMNEPVENAFKAYDICKFFISTFNSPTAAEDLLMDYKGLHNTFSIKRMLDSKDYQFTNAGVTFIQFFDYKFNKLKVW